MKTKIQDQQQYPGAAVDAANGDKVSPCLTKEATRDLNNNPRNDGE